MNKTRYIEKIANIIVKLDNKGKKTFAPTTIYGKYDDPFEINEYNAINDALNEMKENGYIDIRYENKTSNEISKIIILKDAVPLLAKKYSLTIKCDVNKEIEALLLLYKDSQHCEIVEFANNEMLSLLDNKSVRFTQGENTEALKEVLSGANAILSQKEDISLRELSILIYNDSKKLENRLSQIFKIINTNNMDKDTFLEQHHIFRNKTYVLIKGNAIIHFNNGDRITLSNENNGSIQFSNEIVKNIELIDTKSILSIENLTSFENYQTTKNDGIILYLGGFSNNVNIDFIKKVNCPISHFGDIDANGFKILYDLRKRTKKQINSHKMDLETIFKYSKFGKEMSDYNRKTLNQMMLSEIYSPEEKQCFEKLLELNKTIEQEIIKR